MSGWLTVWAPREWRQRWPALIVLAVLVALAGGVATALGAGARRADSSVGRFLAVTGAPNLMAHLDPTEVEPGPDEDLGDRLSAHLETVDDLAALPGVESVRVESWWAISTEPEFDRPGYVDAFALGTFSTAGEPPPLWVVDGELPGPDDPDSVIVNEEAVRVLGAHVGETMRYRTVSPARLAEWGANDGRFTSADALDGPEIAVTVVAVVRSEYDLGEGRTPQIIFPEGFARANREAIAHVELDMFFRIEPSRLTHVQPAVEEILEPYGLQVTPPPSISSTLDPSIGVEVTTLQIAAIAAAVAGALVMATAFGRQAAAIRIDRTIGAALGLTRAQRAEGVWLVLAPAAVVGSLGVPVVAWGLSAMFPQGVARLADPDPGLRLDVPAILLGAAGTLVVALLAVAGSSLVATTRVSAPSPSRARAGGRFLGSPARLLGASFALEPAGTGRRSRVVTGATVGAITLGVAGVVTVATLDSSRAHLTESPRLLGAPGALVYQSNGMFGIDEVVDATLATAGVDAVTRQLTLDEVTMRAVGPAGPARVSPGAYQTVRGDTVPPVVDGLYPNGADEVALGKATAEALGADTGDTIHIVRAGGQVDLALRVSGIVVSWGTDDPQHAFVVTPETLHLVVCADASFDECELTANVFADVGTDAAAAALREAGFQDVPTPANVARLDQVGAIPWYLAVLLCVLAVGGLLNDLLVALRWRRRDLAITRALGLTRGRASDALVWQALLTAMAGVATGIVLGAIAGPVMWRLIAADLGVIADPIMAIVGMALTAMIAIATAALLSIGPRWHATRLPLTTALRSE